MKTKLLSTVFGLLLSFNTFAGGDAGNGGVSVVCRDIFGGIKSAEMLDIYEGAQRYDLKFSTKNYSVQVHMLHVKEKLSRYGAYPQFVETYESVTARKKLLSNVTFNLTEDAYPIFVEKGCLLEQAANYIDPIEFLVSKEIHNRFNNLNQAALVLHETLYLMQRQARPELKSATLVRKLTAYLLSTTNNPEIEESILKQILGL